MALVLNDRDQAVAFFRRRTPINDAYDGSLHLATRQTNGIWSTETIKRGGNCGLNPS